MAHGKDVSRRRQLAKRVWKFIQSHPGWLSLPDEDYRKMQATVANVAKAAGFTRLQVLQEIGNMVIDRRVR